MRIWYKFFTRVSFDTYFLHVMNWCQIFIYVRILQACEDLAPILHIREKSYQFFARLKNKMWNLSINVSPEKLSKLTVRKFHICQNDVFTWCEIYEVWKRFNIMTTKRQITFRSREHRTVESVSSIRYKLACAYSEDSDQSVHPIWSQSSGWPYEE